MDNAELKGVHHVHITDDIIVSGKTLERGNKKSLRKFKRTNYYGKW